MPSHVDSWLHAVSFSLCATLVEAKFPFSSTGPKATLASEDSVTFDPLGVAAVLHNPRADASAAKLYIQYDKEIFHWPHTTMIGGTLAPMQMLVEHLTASITSIHPAIKMCAKDLTMIPVRSDMVFRELPLNLSNLWLNDLISFKSCIDNPGNDFSVICVNAIHEDAEVKIQRILKKPGLTRWMMYRVTLYLLGLINGALILTAMLFGILAADIWAFTLFYLYSSHWVASAVIAFTPMVQVHKPPTPANSTTRYAAYQRPEGGTVIFKGPQDKLEEWARSTWEYKPTLWKTLFHWYWMITGSLAAFASVACMVNMRGYMQLAFLGVLVYSSFAEIVATKLSRFLQTMAKGPIPWDTAVDNKTRSKGIIRATLAVRPECRLEGFEWIKMELLPPLPVFVEMLATLARINKVQREEEARQTGYDSAKNDEIEGIIEDFCRKAPEPVGLSQRVAQEMRDAVKEWVDRKGGTQEDGFKAEPGV